MKRSIRTFGAQLFEAVKTATGARTARRLLRPEPPVCAIPVCLAEGSSGLDGGESQVQIAGAIWSKADLLAFAPSLVPRERPKPA